MIILQQGTDGITHSVHKCTHAVHSDQCPWGRTCLHSSHYGCIHEGQHGCCCRRTSSQMSLLAYIVQNDHKSHKVCDQHKGNKHTFLSDWWRQFLEQRKAKAFTVRPQRHLYVLITARVNLLQAIAFLRTMASETTKHQDRPNKTNRGSMDVKCTIGTDNICKVRTWWMWHTIAVQTDMKSC